MNVTGRTLRAEKQSTIAVKLVSLVKLPSAYLAVDVGAAMCRMRTGRRSELFNILCIDFTGHGLSNEIHRENESVPVFLFA